MNDLIKKAAETIVKADSVIALTGAGISVESGIPPFRGKGSIWDKIDPMEYAHINAFKKDPAKVWHGLLMVMKDILDTATPNNGHKGLSLLEEMGVLQTIITQNIDGLHQLAGNTDVIEFHGNFAWQRCLSCNSTCSTTEVDLSEIPPKCSCGGLLRPECVFFGEMIPEDHLWRSRQLASQCNVMLVIGTSAVVQPAAMMPVLAKNSGAVIIEINPERTPLTGEISDMFLQGPAGSVMTRLTNEIELLL